MKGPRIFLHAFNSKIIWNDLHAYLKEKQKRRAQIFSAMTQLVNSSRYNGDSLWYQEKREFPDFSNDRGDTSR